VKKLNKKKDELSVYYVLIQKNAISQEGQNNLEYVSWIHGWLGGTSHGWLPCLHTEKYDWIVPLSFIIRSSSTKES
jgi:hypothetical protein